MPEGRPALLLSWTAWVGLRQLQGKLLQQQRLLRLHRLLLPLQGQRLLQLY